MKKIFALSLMALLSACAQGSIYKQFDQDCNDHFYSAKACPAKKAVTQKRQEQRSEKVYNRNSGLDTEQNKVRLVAQNADYRAYQQVPTRQKHLYVEQKEVAPVAIKTIQVETPAPVVAPVVVSDTGCNGCQPIVRQTREPVEVIYKKTTYTTVFEPKTTATVTYEKEAVAGQKVISVHQTQEKLVPTEKRVRRVVTHTRPATKSISYTIENTRQAAPNELLIEDVK